MTTQTYGSVIAMEFRRTPSIQFADIVEEFDIAFQMVDSRTRALTWDCDDIALIDRDSVRVALGWLPGKEKGQPTHLVVAVGSAPDAKPDAIDPNSFRFLADRIAERTHDYLPFTAVLHGKATQPVSAELVDTVFDLLRTDTKDMHSDTAAPKKKRILDEEDIDAFADRVGSMGSGWMARDGAAPEADTPRAETASSGDHMLLARAEPTQPLRLSIHALALSLCLYVPALGVAMFAYSMLRDVFPMAANAV